MRALLSGGVVQVQEELERDLQAAAMPFLEHEVEPPLHFALRTGCDVEKVRLLLRHKADVNARDVLGRTPLTLLCSQAELCCRMQGQYYKTLDEGPLKFAMGWQITSAPPTELTAGLAAQPSAAWTPPSMTHLMPLEHGKGKTIIDPYADEKVRVLDLAACLMMAGAHTCFPDSRGRTPVQLASASGQADFAQLVQYYQAAQAVLVLAHAAGPGAGQAPTGIVPFGWLCGGTLRIICSFLLPGKAAKRLLDGPKGRPFLA